MSRKGGSYEINASGETVMVREGGKGKIAKAVEATKPKPSKFGSNKSTKED
jgi:hypothetical protein